MLLCWRVWQCQLIAHDSLELAAFQHPTAVYRQDTPPHLLVLVQPSKGLAQPQARLGPVGVSVGAQQPLRGGHRRQQLQTRLGVLCVCGVRIVLLTEVQVRQAERCPEREVHVINRGAVVAGRELSSNPHTCRAAVDSPRARWLAALFEWVTNSWGWLRCRSVCAEAGTRRSGLQGLCLNSLLGCVAYLGAVGRAARTAAGPPHAALL